VLFAQAADAPPDDAPPQTTALDLSWIDARDGNTAVVVDLPGALSVELGLALAAGGFRPVPLFNACDGRDAALDLKPIVRRLLDGAASLSQRALPDDAPPAFLLDSRRMEVAAPPPGKFDNRWLSFPQDFPSASFLASRGIRRVILVDTRPAPRDDLAHTLRRWQEAGLEILRKEWDSPSPPAPLDVPRPSRFRSTWHRVLALVGLRRNSAGGFGAVVPVPGSGG
jgi:hypothetical protein